MEVRIKLSSSLSTKGQITIPIQIRKRLSLKEGDMVFFEETKGGNIRLEPSRINLERAYGSVKPIKLPFSEQRKIAREEQTSKR